MKSKALVKTGLLLLPLTVLLGVYQWSKPDATVASCQQQRVITEAGIENLQLNCKSTPQQSWLGWAQGESRSTQFHFIDLLELLNRLQHHSDKD